MAVPLSPVLVVVASASPNSGERLEPSEARRSSRDDEFAFDPAGTPVSSRRAGRESGAISGTSAPSGEAGNTLATVWRVIDGVFDFRFRRYLTPYILRVLWALALLSAVSLLLVKTFVTPFVDSADTEAPVVKGGAGQLSPATKPSALSQSISEILGWATGSLFRVVGAVVGLMFVRVAVELAMVVFNISNDLKRLRLPQEPVP